MDDVRAKLEFNTEELWRIKCALKNDMDKTLEFAEGKDDPHRVFKMNAESTLKLYLRIAPLVESYQAVRSTLKKYPLGKFNTID